MLMRQDFLRSQPKQSQQMTRMFSNTAMTVVKLAKVMNTKNRLPHSRPPGILTNTSVRVMKISEGPWSGSMP